MGRFSLCSQDFHALRFIGMIAMNVSEFRMNDWINHLDIENGIIETVTSLPTDETVFLKHFPDFPVLPGTYIIETMAQACGTFMLAQQSFTMLPFLVSIEKSKFTEFSKPQDTLIFKCILKRQRKKLSVFDVIVIKKGKEIANATIKMGCMPFPSSVVKEHLRNNAGLIGLSSNCHTKQTLAL